MTYSFWCFPQAKGAFAFSKAALTYSFGCFPQVKSAFTFSKAALTYSFGCFPQVKSAFTFSKEAFYLEQTLPSIKTTNDGLASGDNVIASDLQPLNQ
ncbi:MAG: hypothetical protein ACYTXY_23155 [Nostoc sp.]